MAAVLPIPMPIAPADILPVGAIRCGMRSWAIARYRRQVSAGTVRAS